MSNIIKAFLKTQPAENHVLFSLLFFLNCEDELGSFNIDAPINDIQFGNKLIPVIQDVDQILEVRTCPHIIFPSRFVSFDLACDEVASGP